MRSRLPVSERRACAVIGQARATQRHRPEVRDDEAALTASIERLATRYGRYGYRRIRRLLVDEGWRVNVKRVYRSWRREGLKEPSKQPKRGRLWLNDGSCVRLRPERPDHVWSYDFVQDRTEDDRTFRMLCVIDEFARRCLAILVARRLRSDDVLQCLTDLFIEPGSPWENGYCESFNSKLRDELLNAELFSTLYEAEILIESWRRHYNAVRPHSPLGYRPSAPEAILPPDPTSRVGIAVGGRPETIANRGLPGSPVAVLSFVQEWRPQGDSNSRRSIWRGTCINSPLRCRQVTA